MLRDPSYGKVVERHGWTRWIWVIWAFLATSALVFSTAILTTRIQISQHQSYPGTLQSRVRETELTLLKGLPLKNLLVQEGESVSAGQTLAILDEERMGIMLDELQNNILADNILRRCLQFLDTPSPEALENGEFDAGTLLKLARANDECQSVHARHDVQIRRILLAESRLEQEHSRKIRNLKLAVQSVSDTEIQTRIAVQIAFEQSDKGLKSGQLELELAALRADQKQEVVEILKGLERSVASARLRKAALEHALSSPRLFAPRDGKVTDLRDVQFGREYMQEILLLKIGAADTFEYIPSFSIPRPEATLLQVGDQVSISTLGNKIDALLLNGVISKIEDTADIGNGKPLVRIDVQLDAHSLTLINDPSKPKHILGKNTRSEFHFTLPKTNLANFLIRATGDLFASYYRI